MAERQTLTYRVSANSTCDWYWEVYTDDAVVCGRGLAETRVGAHVAALKLALKLVEPANVHLAS